MPNINDIYPGGYLKAEDLRGRRVAVTIGNVTVEAFGRDGNGETKAVLHFDGKDKALALNKTNAQTIGAAYGPDTDGWRGRDLILFPTQTDYQGKRVDCLRVGIPAHEQSREAAPILPDDEDDEIPF